MPTGQPDFLAQLASNPTSQTFAAGEDTTRLNMGGGSNSQSGRWLWATGFESGLGEAPVSGVNVKLDTTHVFMGAQSLLLETQAINGDTATMSKSLYTNVAADVLSAKFGIESMLSFSLGANVPREFRWYCVFPQSATIYNRFGIVLKINGINNAGLYIDNNGVQTLISDVSSLIADNADLFHYTKFVFDGVAGTYTRFFIDNLSFDLGGVAGFQVVGLQSGFYFSINHIAKLAAKCDAWIDNVIITADEV